MGLMRSVQSMQDAAPSPLCQSDILDPARACALQIALGKPATITTGSALPPFFHQLYFWNAQPPNTLGRDGHPKTGGLIPDFDLPRRMWAGGRLEFLAPLIAGTPAHKTTTLHATTRKNGRSGPLAFITLRHEFHQNERHCLTEYQDLVYREEPAPNAPHPTAPMARTDETHSKVTAFNSTLLFRYSALTFNGPRIHYDADYARDIEGYDGLVVHGPLLAHLLMELASQHLGHLKTFSFRATAPLLHFETAVLCWSNGTAWVRGPDGRQNMIASAT